MRRAGLLVPAVLTAACTTGGSERAAAPSPSTVLPVAQKPLWLCHPDEEATVCGGYLDAVAVTADGASPEPFEPAVDAAVDCFYAYPTVSQAPGDNAPREVEPAVVATVRAQAALFGEVCDLHVPVYRQVTLAALRTGRYLDPAAQQVAYDDVRDAWRRWVAEADPDRGVVLIGHSQGAMVLARLLSQEVLAEPDVRDRVVSAVLVCGGLTTAEGSDVVDRAGGLPACREVAQTGCVVAYSTFADVPPDDALFGRTVVGRRVVCTDPTRLSGGDDRLDPYVPTDRLAPDGGLTRALPAPDGAAAFVTYPGAATAECRSEGGADWLQVTPVPGAPLPEIDVELPPSWGLHAVDVSVALGDLVELVRRQAQAWRARG